MTRDSQLGLGSGTERKIVMTLLQMVIYIHMNRRVSAGSPSLFGLCHNLKTSSVDFVLNSSLEMEWLLVYKL